MVFEQLNPHACRTWLVVADGADRALLVDPVLDHAREYLAMLGARGLRLAWVIDTHTHADHISAGAALRDETGCEYLMHELAPARCVTRRLRDGERLSLGGIDCAVVHTPGHTRDSISLVIGDRLLTGDCLFLDSAGGGRDDLPGGDPGAHWESLRKLADLPDNLVVCPAHEYRDRQPATLGSQRIVNPHLAPRTREEFVRYLEDLKLGPADWMKDVLAANYACARDPGAAWIPVDMPACEIKGTLALNANERAPRLLAPAALRTLLDGGAPPVLLDVREPAELLAELGRLPGVVNIPVTRLASRLGELEAHRQAPVVVVCRSGGRATTGAQILLQAGFTDVAVLEGGMSGWRAAGYR